MKQFIFVTCQGCDWWTVWEAGTGPGVVDTQLHKDPGPGHILHIRLVEV